MQPELVAMGIGSLSVSQLGPHKICNFVPAILAGQAHRCHSTAVLLGRISAKVNQMFGHI
jgi:hypothetical protein